jgi:dTDP-4-amino-4,6-dideoxygalactose transaminase
MQPYYKNLGFKVGDFPNAEKYYQQAVTLPLFPDLTKGEVFQIVTTLTNLVNALQ